METPSERLPSAILTAEEAEKVLALPDIHEPLGLRDRAMLEVLYSTGIRRKELCALCVHDIDHGHGTLFIRLGKGRKDRIVPIGERALAWLDKYLVEARPGLVRQNDSSAVFLAATGAPLDPRTLTSLAGGYVREADIGKMGSCHLFRHTAATLMLEGGADIRSIQELLGHEQLTSTQIYTRVSIARLKEVHTRTHPAARLARGEPEASARGDEEREDGR